MYFIGSYSEGKNLLENGWISFSFPNTYKSIFNNWTKKSGEFVHK